MTSLTPTVPAVKRPLAETAAERVRELASIHRAVCRHCKPGGTEMRCSVDYDLRENANRLEQKAAEMAARRERLEVARGS